MPVMMFFVLMVLGESRRRDCESDDGCQDNSSKFLHSPNSFNPSM
jgi:hypothetical protein